MKYHINFKLILSICLCAFLAASCVKEGPEGPTGPQGAQGEQGPQGPAGPAGADGEDGQGINLCMECHNTDLLVNIQAQFTTSAHSAGEKAVGYAGARTDCVPCHSHEQFVQYAELGYKELKDKVTNPSAWKCNTCHSLHEDFEGSDIALRVSGPVTSYWDWESATPNTMDLGGHSNLCATCHQTRRQEPNIAAPSDSFYISSTHYGPHHGPQANIVYGVDFAEIPGDEEYPEPASSLHYSSLSCVGCHMGEYGAGGGHSFKPNLDACQTCHSGAEDFNINGAQTEVEEDLVVLRDLLIARGVVEWVEEDEAYEPVVGTYPLLHVKAFFNWIGLEEDRSKGAHNPKYVKALLANTIAALQAE